MERALSRKLIGKHAARELLAMLSIKLPRFEQPTSKSAWRQQAAPIRRQVLASFFRGHPPGLLEARPRVQWGDTIETGHGYRIRKLRYEGYPGLWVPALLYEPAQLHGRVPAVLNPNGHHVGGKAVDYKQARCINLAKRGMLALNTEFLGMGELRADGDHNRIAHLDLCGTAGIGVFYLLMKRGLDVLLRHPHADPERVAMTGLSGGGWQTALLAALDERIRVVVPVAGHSPVWQRIGHPSDIGDQEQVPSDLCTIADFDTLTALFPPRPTLLIYNRNDDCCFQTRRTRKSVYEPVKAVYKLFGAADKLGFHDNVDPGTHNYESDNRSQLYRFLNQHWDLDTPNEDLPWQDELCTEAELEVGLPPDNATLLTLSQQALRNIRQVRQQKKKSAPATSRRRLAALLKMPTFDRITVQQGGAVQQRKDLTIHHHVVCLDDTWSVPMTELVPPRPRGVELIVCDGGRRNAAALARQALAAGRRALVADIFGTGEAATTWQYHMLMGTAGERPLGVQVGQLMALIQWAGRRFRVRAPHLRASGQVMAVVGLLAAALDPARLAGLTTEGLMDTLDRLIDWPVPYESAAPLFCFGLLQEFDLPGLIELSAPMPLHDQSYRGPLRL